MKALTHKWNIVSGLIALLFAVLVPVTQAQSQAKPLLLASLRPSQELLWKRVSPTPQQPDGPVLYQIIFRSSATPGFVPKISSSFTLTNSLISESGSLVSINGTAAMSGFQLSSGGAVGKVLTSDASGNGTWQLAPAGGSGTVTSVATGTGLTGGPITTAGTISIANGGVTTAQIGSGAATNGQILAANGSGGVSWQTLTPALTNAWSFNGNSGTGCVTSPCAKFLGTIDNTSFETRVNNLRVYRMEPGTSSMAFGSFNIIGGYGGNTVTAGVGGATIAGGGANSSLNIITDDFGTIGGGNFNQAGDNAGTTSDHAFATVAGGRANNATGGWSSVGGGFNNTAGGSDSIVGGGESNNASATDSTIGGGNTNHASGFQSTVGGGTNNTASGPQSIVAGGSSNTSSSSSSFVGGGGSNTANAPQSTVGGGQSNFATGTFSTVMGGSGNLAGNAYAVVGGGFGNFATAIKATISGGGRSSDSDSTTGNRVTDDFGTVGGGGNNQAGDNAGTTSDKAFATVGGGLSNTASGLGSTVAGGRLSTAGNNSDSVGGGYSNIANAGAATVAGGQTNSATGFYSSVPGGLNNTASGTASFAAGQNANAANNFAFAWCDGESTPCTTAADKEFLVVANGGIRFFVGPGGHGCVMFDSANVQWSCSSDRNLKENFETIDKRKLLEQVVAMPVTRWNFRSSRPWVKHIGPTAQDFYAAFHLSENEKYIGTTDVAGVTLAAIQGLNQKLEEELKKKDNAIAALRVQVESQSQEKVSQQRRIQWLEQQMRRMAQQIGAIERNHSRATLARQIATVRP
jgi:hypothetical protein